MICSRHRGAKMEFLQYRGQNFGNSVGQSGGGSKRRKSGNCGVAPEDSLAPVRQRSQANARERDRTHSVNTAFSTLRTLIPTEPKDRKLSKIETLRLASSYISHLASQLIAGPVDQPCLRVPKNSEENTNSYQVCTFCIAHKKAPRTILTEGYECPNFEGQIFLAPVSSISPSTQASMMTINDSSIYY